ncbi:hypothetical protein B0T25DRAFT_418890, partial [Lasiosphaeria hispida]
MSSCSLGVNAFRSSTQVAAHQLSRSCVRLRLLTAAPSGRCFSSWQPLAQQHHRQERRRGCDRGLAPIACGLLRNYHTPLLYPQRTGLRTLKLSGHRVIIHYIDLPPNYDDLTGLPFRRQDLTADEVVTVFGTKTSTFAANKLLRILHGRRIAGTLEDPTVQINTSAYSAREKKVALAYLRRNVHVDEIVNAGLRAEDELAEMEQRDARKDEGVKEAETAEEQGSQPSSVFFKKDSQPDGGVYGRGAFDAIRAKNRERYEQDLKRRDEEAAKRKEEEEAAGAGSGELQTAGERQVRAPSPSMQKWIEKATSDLEAPPELKKWERLLPSAVFVFILTGLAVAYSVYYHPLKRSDRMFPDIPPAAATVGAIVLLNVGVWFLWKVPPLWPALNRYFLLASATPKPLSMLGAMFSHQKMSHLLTNMVVLWFVGSRFHDDVGRGNFLATYIATGSLGFLGSLTSLVLRNQLHLTTLGASGGVYGVAVAYFWMHRYECFKLFGLPPEPFNGVPGMGFIGLLVGLNISAMFAKVPKVDVVSHLVGMAVGALAGHLLERQREER